MLKLAELIEANADEMAAIESLDNGAGGREGGSTAGGKARARAPACASCAADGHPAQAALRSALTPTLPLWPACPSPGKPLYMAKAADIPLAAGEGVGGQGARGQQAGQGRRAGIPATRRCSLPTPTLPDNPTHHTLPLTRQTTCATMRAGPTSCTARRSLATTDSGT